MIGATVRVKGSDVATITDLDGKFQIDVHEGSELLISYVGYMDKIVRIDSKNMYAVVMEEASNALNEVVVISYGAVKKKALTGAVAAVKGEELVNKRTAMLSNALQGSLSGTQGSFRRQNSVFLLFFHLRYRLALRPYLLPRYGLLPGFPFYQ